MSKRSIPGGVKDENGIFVKTLLEKPAPPTASEPDPEISIDSLMTRGLLTIDRIMKACLVDASTGSPSRESVQNLKDCMIMLDSLKKKENDLLDNMSDEQIQEFLSKRK